MKRSCILLLLLFTILPVSHFASPVQAQAIRLPGVRVGDWAKYDAFYNFTTNDPEPPFPLPPTDTFEEIDYFKTNVESVEGTNITFQIIVRLKNGTEMSSILWEDLSAALGSSFFVAANLTAGDTLYLIPPPYSPVINATVLKDYACAEREVNCWMQTRDLTSVNIENRTYRASGQSATYWDRASGILDEMVQDTLFARVPEGYETRMYLRFLIVETNIWSGRTIAIVDAKTGLSHLELVKGSSFTLNVTLSGKTDFLHGFQVAISFNNTIIKCNAALISMNDPNQVFHGQSGPVMQFFIVNNRAGFVATGTTLGIDYVIPSGEYRHYVNVSGERLLCQLNFTAQADGNSPVELQTLNYYYNTSLIDSNDKQMKFVGTDFSVNVSTLRMIAATVVFTPAVLNLRSSGKWITAFVELPNGYNVKEVDLSTIMLNETIHPVSVRLHFGKSFSCLIIKFERKAVINMVLRSHQGGRWHKLEKVTLTVAGKLKNGKVFQGNNTVAIIWKSLLHNPFHFQSDQFLSSQE